MQASIPTMHPPIYSTTDKHSLEVIQEVETGSGNPSSTSSQYARVTSSHLLVSQDETLVSGGSIFIFLAIRQLQMNPPFFSLSVGLSCCPVEL